MEEIKTLDLTVQDLPKDVTLDLSESGGDAVLTDAIESLKSEVLYNSRFDDATVNGHVDAEVVNRQGATYVLRLTFKKSVA